MPPGPARPLILAATYVVATVSVALQGLTFEPLTRALHKTGASGRAGESAQPIRPRQRLAPHRHQKG